MARRKSATTATPTSTKGHKRQLSTPATTVASTPGTRTSKRLKESTDGASITGKVTPKKSKYFEGTDSEEEEQQQQEDELSESGYEDEDASATEPSDEPSDTDDYGSEEDSKLKSNRKKQAQQRASGKAQSNGDGSPSLQRADLWKEGVKTGLGPGKQVFIAKPKPRGDGGIKYVPQRIHPNTMAFLSDLKKNNDREWLKMHDPDYRQSWKDWESFVEILTEKIAEVDETVPELPPKDVVFRIYRDVRFSKDPTPYKPHYSAAWSRTGRKGPYAAYYIQIQPGGHSFVGGGLWHPEAQPLGLLRRNIDRRPERIREVLTDAAIRKQFFNGVSKDEKKAIKAFIAQPSNVESALKTKPKGYDVDHANIGLLRLKNFTMGKRLEDSEILNGNVLDRIVELVAALHPFVTYLNSVVMPDEPDEDDESEEDDAVAPDDEEGSDADEDMDG